MLKQMVLFMILLLAACSQQPPLDSTEPVPELATESSQQEEATRVTASPAQQTAVERGKVLYNTLYERVGFACITCHYSNSQERFIGPGLAGISTRIASYYDEGTPAEYIRQSILAPQDFIVPDASPYPENVMPRNYGEIFTEDELDDLVEYILSL